MAGRAIYNFSHTQLPAIVILYALIFCQCVKYVEAKTKISCLSCHVDSYPFSGCLDTEDVTMEQIAGGTGEGSNLYFRGIDVVDKCETCGIEDTWHPTTGKFLYRRKLCFATDSVSSSGCSYEYPVGGEEVVEVCYCNTDLCNMKDIASLGGEHDLKKFPTMKPYEDEVSKATRGREGIGILIIMMALNYFHMLH